MADSDERLKELSDERVEENKKNELLDVRREEARLLAKGAAQSMSYISGTSTTSSFGNLNSG